MLTKARNHQLISFGALFLGISMTFILLTVLSGVHQVRAQGPLCIVDDDGGTGVDFTTIQAAVDDVNCETIQVEPGVYLETLSINRDVAITGTDPANTIIDGQGFDRVLLVSAGEVSISDLTLQNGHTSADGGGVQNLGVLTITNSVILSNTSSDSGGGVDNHGVLYIYGSTISNNRSLETASSHPGGGGLLNQETGHVVLSDTILFGNTATRTGGGVENRGVLLVENSDIISSTSSEAGGGVYNYPAGVLTITGGIISGNVTDESGGGIFNLGLLSISQATLINNQSENHGGGVYHYPLSLLTLSAVTVTGNIADPEGDDNGRGGGVFTFQGPLEIKHSHFFGNHADWSGGGLYAQGALTVEHSTFASNTAWTQQGGGLFSSDVSTYLFQSRFSGNAASSGGAVYASRGEITIDQCEIYLNSATTGGGLRLYNNPLVKILQSDFQQNSAGNGGGGGLNFSGSSDSLEIIDTDFLKNEATGDGGGLYILGVSLLTQIGNSAIVSNTAGGSGGGLHLNLGNMTTTITNTTISGNLAEESGGGIHFYDGVYQVYLNNVTIVDNAADLDRDEVGDGGGLAIDYGEVSLSNSILARNQDRSVITTHLDCSNLGLSGELLSNGYNLVGAADSCIWVGSLGDITGTVAMPVDPLLAPLDENGSGSFTNALLPGSPAVDGGNPAPPGSGGGSCEAMDQHHVARPVDGDGNGSMVCDIGAYEAQPVPPATVSLAGPSSVEVSETVPFTATTGPISTTFPVDYHWQATEQMPVTHTAGLADQGTFTWLEPGIKVITVTAENLWGSAGDVITVTVQDKTISGLMAANNSPVSLGDPVVFTGTVQEGTNVNYAWDFGDSRIAAGQYLTHTYAAGGVYTATLTAWNSVNTLSTTTYVTITTPTRLLYLPMILRETQALTGRPLTRGYLPNALPAALILATWLGRVGYRRNRRR